jgi:hypothetical protein
MWLRSAQSQSKEEEAKIAGAGVDGSIPPLATIEFSPLREFRAANARRCDRRRPFCDHHDKHRV